MATPLRTTLAAAVAIGDSKITVASATGLTAGRVLKIDNETMKITSDYVSGVNPSVLRGLDGSVQTAHVNGSAVNHGAPEDFANPPAQSAASVSSPLNRVRVMSALNAAGAIPINTPGVDQVCQLNGAVAIAATLGNPAPDNDGDILIVVGNGAAAHTLSYAAGLGNGGAAVDLLTFAAGARNSVMLIAAGGFWCPLPSLIGGVATVVTVTVS